MSDYCDCGDLEYVTLWHQKTRKSRRERQCRECKETIEVGESYEDIRCLFEGDWDRMAICQYCAHDYRILRDLGMCVPLGDGELERAWHSRAGA